MSEKKGSSSLAMVAAIVAFLFFWSRNRFPKGDVNGDGKVDATDIHHVERMILLASNDLDGNRPYTAAEKARADVNGDGQITMSDVIAIEAIINVILHRRMVQQRHQCKDGVNSDVPRFAREDVN